MNIYIIFWIFIVVMSYIELNSDVIRWGRVRIPSKKICFVSVVIFATLLGCLRNDFLGVDVNNYRSHFYSVSQYGLKETIEYGRSSDVVFFILSRILAVFSKEYSVYKVLLYILTFGVSAWVIYKKSKYPTVSFMTYIALGFLGYNFCILRQAIAMAVCFYAFKYVEEKKIKKFIIAVVVAASLHSTAIVFLAVYPIVNSKISSISTFKKIMIMIASFVFARFGLPIAFRLFHTNYSADAIAGQGFVKLLTYIVIIAGISVLYSSKSDTMEDKSNYKRLYDTAYMSIYMQIIALSFSLFTRISQYFVFYIALVVPYIFLNDKKRIYFVLYAAMCSMLFFYMLPGMDIVPYVSIFKKM